MAAESASDARTGVAVDRLTASAAISARGLGASYANQVVWSGATFDVPEGSFTAVLGPNGSGKTTLIKQILGQHRPAAGTLEVFGHVPHRGDPTIGYVPQRATFDPELSIDGWDFVGLGVDGHRWGVRIKRRGVADAIDAAIHAVDAGAYAARPLGRLSGGEQQRLLLAEALVGRPRMLLMDEPLSYLDVRNQRSIVELIARVKQERGLTVLLIAHDVNPLLPHVDHVIYVAGGGIAMGKPDEIITTKRLSEIYATPVEVIRDSRGRVFVVGLEEESAHPHA